MSQAPVKVASSVPKNVSELVSKMSLSNDDGPLVMLSMRLLEKGRRLIYGQIVKELTNKDSYAIIVECRPKDSEEELIEKIINVNKECNKTTDIILECKISLEEFSPSGLIEYSFNENGKWYLSQMCLDSLEYYKTTKFKNWKEMIEKPDCKAAFKRLLNIGLITQMFDHVAFPSPEHEKADWEVKDKNNKTVIIPRPVHQLRIWNVKKKNYDIISAHLTGAPKKDEAQAYWNEMMKNFRNQYGDEYIDQLLQNNNNNKS